MSLKLKTSLLVSSLLAAAIGSLTAVLLWNEKRALAAAMQEERLAQADALAEVCRDAIIGQQYIPLTNYLMGLKQRSEVLGAFCVSTEGEVLGHTDLEQVHDTLMDEPLRSGLAGAGRGFSEGLDGPEATAPVLVGPNRLAAVRIFFSREALRRRFDLDLARARRRILQVSAPVLLGGFAGAFFLTALVLRPVGDLVEGVRTVARGKLDHIIPVRSQDEIGWLAREFNQMAEKLHELDRMKQDFVSGVTHDLKSPIAAMRLGLDVIREEAEKLLGSRAAPARMGESFLHVRDRLDRLNHLIGSLLDVARIESLLSLDKRPVNLEEVAERVVKSFDLIARQKGLSLVLAVLNKVPAVQGDEAKLERALSNLVGNAVKFTTKGKVEVRLQAAGGAAEVSVADTGPGMPPEAMEKLFSKFFRLRRPGESLEGTGLGLAIVKGFVEAHGGTVSAESRPGEGSVFRMRIPL